MQAFGGKWGGREEDGEGGFGKPTGKQQTARDSLGVYTHTDTHFHRNQSWRYPRKVLDVIGWTAERR